MGNITDNIIKQVYPLAKGVHKKKLEAIDKLHTDAEMNRNSAKYYVQAVLAMMEGRRYEKKTNSAATRYFLEMIYAEFGRDALVTALSSLQQHIDYCEEDEKATLYGLRKIHQEFLKKL